VGEVMHEALADEQRTTEIFKQQLTAELTRLDTQDENLLDFVANGEMATSKVKVRLGRIHQQQERVRQQLDAITRNLEAGVALLERALRLLENPQKLYRSMGPKQRQLLNLAIFEKLYVIEDYVSDATYHPPFDELVRLKAAWQRAEEPETLQAVESSESSVLARSVDPYDAGRTIGW
jgi:site-specific DNA recombinase